VAFDDHRRGSWEPFLFRVEEYGRRWRRIADEDDLRGFVHTVEEDPTTPNLLFAGTEFGLWVSLNRGQDWFPWEYGIPAVPVRSVVVHARDFDLVVGTHGRSLYVLDDIRPLQDLAADPSIASTDLYLFGPPPAFLISEGAADGYHFAGDALFQGESRPRGALLTYWMGEEADSLGLSRVTVEILDSFGEEVRSLEGPAEVGLNRIVWDLREANPLEGAASAGRLGREGPEVLPGSYRIRVRAGPHRAASALAVLPDPREDIPLEERIQRRRALDRALELVRVSVELQNGLDSLRAGTQRIRAQLRDAGEDQGSRVRALADSAEARAGSLRRALGEAREGLRGLSSLASTRDRPTEADRINLIRAEEALDRLIPRFNAFLAGAVEDLRRALLASGLRPMPQVGLVQRRPVGQNEGGPET
jgi:hypothetical protein